MYGKHHIVVPGGLNTDLMGLGVERILQPGELTLGGSFHIGPGGKARNMAQMAAVLLGNGQVAMIGKSVRDPFGLWRVPIDSLQKAGVDISGIGILDFEHSGHQFPGIALIPVDHRGRNQIYCLPGINRDFLPPDLHKVEFLFQSAVKPAFMILALEIPRETVLASIELAGLYGIKVVLDPGGIGEGQEGNRTGGHEGIPLDKLFFIKPNEHEAETLTGLPISDFESAGRAAAILMEGGVQHVMITHGAQGAYLFGPGISEHISIPEVPDTGIYDETGCGDQVTATLTACMAEGFEIREAARLAVMAGTLQFGRKGIDPVERRYLGIDNR